MNVAYIPLFLGIFLNAAAQLLLKAGMERIGYFSFSLNNVFPIALQVAVNPYIILGLTFYVFSVAAWLLALSRVEVSIAYPLLSVAYIVNAVAAYYLLNESFNLTRIVGIFVILAGVFLVARS
ncbi:MAG: EamA family transporter [Coxiellaceae bacterium]|nr:MAG: EamA family transporter [Coxiellaceae bacterium]